MGVSINGGPPKWMVYNGQSHLEIDDLGVPLFQETSILQIRWTMYTLSGVGCVGSPCR